MSAPMNVALAVVLLLGLSSPAFAESNQGKPAKRVQVHKPPQRQAPPAQAREPSVGSGCFSDDGGGRIRPCESGGGGGGGGGY